MEDVGQKRAMRKLSTLTNGERAELATRIRRKINRDGPTSPHTGTPCWAWTGGTTRPNGYGQIGFLGRRLLAHRATWELANGDVPDGRVVMHKCDTQGCCRLDHLQLGTQLENTRDRDAKGRNVTRAGPYADTTNWRRGDGHYSQYAPEFVLKGERHGMAKLTNADVLYIRAVYGSPGATKMALAKKYGVGHSTITRILDRRSWKHLPEAA